MARIRPILAALVTALRRDFRTLASFSGNNLFVVGVALLFLGDPGAFVALSALVALVLFIPLSADPLRLVPGDRLALWPLRPSERRALRILSPWLNPVTWLVLAVALWKRVSFGVCAVLAGAFAVGFVLPSLPPARRGVWRQMPGFPGRSNHLIRKNLRETLSTLDFWCAAALSGLCLALRAAGFLPADALLPMTVVVMLAFSTCAQTLFGLDGQGGMTRYRLLPVRGWEILAAKDVSFLLASLALTLPLKPVAGLAGALAALAAGHSASVTRHSNQVRWRFSSGVSFAMSAFQVVILCMAAAATDAAPSVLLACAGLYAWSTWRSSRQLERLPL